MKKKVLTVFGTRPEALKLAPLVAELERRAHEFESVVCVTGQHRALLDSVLTAFGLKPRHDLDLMRPGQTLEELTARVLGGVAGVIIQERPDVVIVQGDTTTCFASALAAYYARVPVGHVEAGLRTGDLYAPFPEEANRRLVDHLAAYLFAPTPEAADNLRREGVPEAAIHMTGNTVVDAVLWAKEMVKERAAPLALDLAGRRLVVVTAHRRESFGPGMEAIFRAVVELARRVEDILLVCPIHPNPNVTGPARPILAEGGDRVVLTEPLGYLDFVWLMSRASLLLSDSGGVQEEAASLGVPLLVMRQVTERPEALRAGGARLVGTDGEAIVREALAVLSGQGNLSWRGGNPFGDGQAARRIADCLRNLP